MPLPMFGMATRLIAGCIFLLATGEAARGESKRFGEYEVIYTVVNTRFLRPEIAASYGIRRANDRALLNIALRRGSGADSTAVAARVTAERGDLMRKSAIVLREVHEPAAIYYLGEFPFENAETQYFRLSLVPEGDNATLSVDFSKTLYAD
jgi:Domain of unknown function (DUF4426)